MTKPLRKLQIPEKYPQFQEKVLLLCLTHRSAKVYIAEGSSISEFDEIHTELTDYAYTDKEGFSVSRQAGNRGVRPGADQHNKEHYERVFLNYLAEEITKMETASPFAKIIIFAPVDLKNITKEKLPHALGEKTEVIAGNLVNASPLELLERLAADK